MTKLKIKPWNIPRSDNRPRCGKCYRVFKKGELQFRSKDTSGYRFPKVGACCYIPGENTKEYNTLNLYDKNHK